MERTHIKNSFVGFAHRVAPLQNIFRKECDADLNTDVLEFFSGLQNELVGKMMDGACAITQHRRSKDVAAEDLLCHLDMQWNLDPLHMAGNCFKNCYRVSKTTDKIDLSLSPEPSLKKKKVKRSSNIPKVRPASSKVKKNCARKSKLKSKCDQSMKISNSESKVNWKSQDVCLEHPFKVPLPFLNKKPKSKLKAKKQLSMELSGPDLPVKFHGNNEQNLCNVDVSLKPVVVPTFKEAGEKISICESSIKVPPFKEKAENKLEVPVWYCLDPKTNTLKITGLRQHVADAVPKSAEASISKLKSKVEQLSTCERSINLPFKEEMEAKNEVPTTFYFDPEAHTFRIGGLRQDGTVSEQFPKAPLCKSKSKVDKVLNCKSSIQVLPCTGKTEPGYKLAKHALIKIPCPDSQALKIHREKGKQEEFGVKCASIKTLEDSKPPSVEIPHQDSNTCKISVKRQKPEVFDNNDVHVETPEEARKKLAIVLLRIAGKY